MARPEKLTRIAQTDTTSSVRPAGGHGQLGEAHEGGDACLMPTAWDNTDIGRQALFGNSLASQIGRVVETTKGMNDSQLEA